MKQKTVAIVGAGIAGIATSIRLACKGYQVEVFEANAYPGGKLSQISQAGYRFDAGPSLFTMPHFVDELFELAGKNPREHFDYIQLEETCRYFYEDGTQLTAYADAEKFAEEVAQKTADSRKAVHNFLADSQQKYRLTEEVFLKNSLHRFENYLTKATWRGIKNFYKLDVFTSLAEVNRRYFRDPKMQQFFNRFATYNGSDPYQTPGIMNIIPHLEFGFGAFFPKGGMYQITLSLCALAESLGVKFHYDTPVQQILTEGKKTIGLELAEGKKRQFDKVVSNADVVSTYKRLLPQQKPPERLLTQPKSSSALIFYWGIRKEFAQLKLHNIFFSEDYPQEFYYLFRDKSRIYEDPTVYVNISSKHAPEDAPEGCENWFTMVNAPNNEGQDWDKIIAETRENILKKLSRLLKVEIKELIETEAILDPRLIEQKTASAQGALYGNSSNNRFAAFLRHANASSKIKGLYFCGGSVHPGGGIPLCLLSAKITSDFF